MSYTPCSFVHLHFLMKRLDQCERSIAVLLSVSLFFQARLRGIRMSELNLQLNEINCWSSGTICGTGMRPFVLYYTRDSSPTQGPSGQVNVVVQMCALACMSCVFLQCRRQLRSNANDEGNGVLYRPSCVAAASRI